MSETARERILFTMQSALKSKPAEIVKQMAFPLNQWTHQQKLEKLKNNLESVRSEVHITNESSWVDTLKNILKTKQIKTLLFSPDVEIGAKLNQELAAGEQATELVTYQGPIEAFKTRLFEIDAAITSTRGAIAENGAIVLWPDQKEPRLMSLVPPIHIAVLHSSTIFSTFNEALESGKWTEGMPTNVVLTSGPSKTADIELVLAFGVHGPKELVVIIID